KSRAPGFSCTETAAGYQYWWRAYGPGGGACAMAAARMDRVLDYLRRTARGLEGERTDRQLLDRFRRLREGAACTGLARGDGGAGSGGDGAGGVPAAAAARARRRGRLPGHLPGAGPQGRLGGPAGAAGQLAVRGGAADRPGGAGAGGPPANPGAARRAAGGV